jgi:hypothetical protein
MLAATLEARGGTESGPAASNSVASMVLVGVGSGAGVDAGACGAAGSSETETSAGAGGGAGTEPSKAAEDTPLMVDMELRGSADGPAGGAAVGAAWSTMGLWWGTGGSACALASVLGPAKRARAKRDEGRVPVAAARVAVMVGSDRYMCVVALGSLTWASALSTPVARAVGGASTKRPAAVLGVSVTSSGAVSSHATIGAKRDAAEAKRASALRTGAATFGTSARLEGTWSSELTSGKLPWAKGSRRKVPACPADEGPVPDMSRRRWLAPPGCAEGMKRHRSASETAL